MRVAFGAGSACTPRNDLRGRGPLALDSFRLSSIRLRAGPADLGPALHPRGARDFEVPRQIGRYCIEGEIARGGVGVVFKARDLELGRSVALKILRGGHQANAELARRFVEEAQIAGQLQHPGIVSVHDVGVYGDNRPYFVMKLVKGKTLAALLRQCRHRSAERQHFLAIFRQICQALAYAHARGVIHRDLKPSNVMAGGFGDVQVMDWGLSKVLAASGTDADRSAAAHVDDSVVATLRSGSTGDGSVAGSIIGTPSYMPPEQARGEVKDLDERADVFGLGAILCEIITGEPPYAGETLEETQGYARRGELTPALERLEGCGADREVIRLAQDCLAFAPCDRPSDAGAVAERMNTYLESLEERAQRLEIETAEARVKALEERRARRRTRTLSVLALVALVMAGGALVLWLRASARVRLGDVNERAKIDRIDREVELLINPPIQVPDSGWALQRVGDLSPRASFPMQERIREFERSVQLLQRLEELPVMPPSYYDLGENIDAWFQEAFEAYGLNLKREVHEVAADIRASRIPEELILFLDVWAALKKTGTSGALPTPDHIFEIAMAADLPGLRRREEGDSRGEAELRLWRRRFREAIGGDDIATVRRLAEVAEVEQLSDRRLVHLAAYVYRHDRETAVALLRRAVFAHPDSFWIHYWLGFVLALTNPEEARRHLYAALVVRPRSARVHRRYAYALLYAGKLEEALSMFGRAIELDPEHYLASYQTSMRILDRSTVREQRSELAGALDSLIATLDGVLERGECAPRTGKTFVAAWALKPTIHWQRPLDVATSEVNRTERKDREALAMLAQVQWIKGERQEAVRTLEETLRLHGEIPANVLHFLETWRGELSPALASYASVDAQLAVVGGSVSDLTGLLDAVTDVPAQHAYLKGRIAQLDRRLPLAIEQFEEATKLDCQLPEPHLRLAEALRASGDSDAAEKVLFDVLQAEAFDYPALWNLWATIATVDLGRTPEQILADFPVPRAEPRRGDHDERFIVYQYGEDLHWLLEQLRDGQPIRVNCGGERYRDWGRDRFFTRGAQFYGGIDRFTGEIEGDDEPLFATGRWFPTMAGMPSTYAFPLPPGRYRVTLRFAEIYYAAAQPGMRQFHVDIEGKRHLERYDTMAVAGFAKADDPPLPEITVEDGMLDIEFQFVFENGKKKGNPAISAIEIVRLR